MRNALYPALKKGKKIKVSLEKAQLNMNTSRIKTFNLSWSNVYNKN